MLLPALEDPQAAVLRRFDTLASEAVEEFVTGKEDLDRYGEVLRYLVSSALTLFPTPSSRFQDGIIQQHERWKETAAKYAEDAALPPRRWNIKTSGDRAQMEGWVADYESLAVDVMGARGIKFDHDYQAANGLLDLVHEYLARMKSPYVSDWAIRPLCLATAKYCSAQRTLAVKRRNAEHAELFGELRRRCLELANECGESDENRRAGMFAYSRGIGAAQNTDRPELPDSTITAPMSDEVGRLDVLSMPNGALFEPRQDIPSAGWPDDAAQPKSEDGQIHPSSEKLRAAVCEYAYTPSRGLPGAGQTSTVEVGGNECR